MAYTAVVTGASGYIATELVKQLLEKGYNVRGTVRSVTDADKTEHLTLLGDALPGTLTLFEADLLKEGSFDEAVRGADYVFHTASPFIREVKDAQADLVDPAVKGTLNVLASVAKSKSTVKRVALTSSFAAIIRPGVGPSGRLYNENDWNDVTTIEDGAYRYSKTEAEKAAWKFAKENDIDLVVINPTFVIGPVISRRIDGTSVGDLKAVVEGVPGASIFGHVCDVRDIARAHVLAAETPSAKGRYLVSQGWTHPMAGLLELLRERFPQYQFGTAQPEEPVEVIDNSKVQKELGLKLTPVKDSLIDAAVTLIQLGLAKPKLATK